MDVFNISDYIMCPAQKGNLGRQGTQNREKMNRDPESHDQRFLFNLPFLFYEAGHFVYLLTPEFPQL